MSWKNGVLPPSAQSSETIPAPAQNQMKRLRDPVHPPPNAANARIRTAAPTYSL